MDDITYEPSSATPHLSNWLIPGSPVGVNDKAVFLCKPCDLTVENTGAYEAMERWLAGLYDEHFHCDGGV